MATPVKKNSQRRRGSKTSTVVWVVLVVLLGAAGVMALNVSKRMRRVVQETNSIKQAHQEAARRQEAASKLPARKEFSPAFLQMAFGDNPPLLEEIKGVLQEAIGAKPRLAQGDVALMLVTYRAEGELHDVAIHIFGNLIPERMPAFSAEGYWKSQLPPTFYEVGQSLLSTLGRNLIILAKPEVEEKQRHLMEALLNNQMDVIRDTLREPLSFIVIVPEPGALFTERYRPYLAATLIKGKISNTEARVEVVSLSYDQQKAKELAQLISDIQLMGISLIRIRFGQREAEQVFDQLLRCQIRADGPVVSTQFMIPQIGIERGLPKLVLGLSKGINRLKRGPGYPM